MSAQAQGSEPATVHEDRFGDEREYLRLTTRDHAGSTTFRTGASHIYYELMQRMPRIASQDKGRTAFCRRIAKAIHPLAARLLAQAAEITLSFSPEPQTFPTNPQSMITAIGFDAQNNKIIHAFVPPQRHRWASMAKLEKPAIISSGLLVICRPLRYRYHSLKDTRKRGKHIKSDIFINWSRRAQKRFEEEMKEWRGEWLKKPLLNPAMFAAAPIKKTIEALAQEPYQEEFPQPTPLLPQAQSRSTTPKILPQSEAPAPRIPVATSRINQKGTAIKAQMQRLSKEAFMPAPKPTSPQPAKAELFPPQPTPSPPAWLPPKPTLPLNHLKPPPSSAPQPTPAILIPIPAAKATIPTIPEIIPIPATTTPHQKPLKESPSQTLVAKQKEIEKELLLVPETPTRNAQDFTHIFQPAPAIKETSTSPQLETIEKPAPSNALPAPTAAASSPLTARRHKAQHIDVVNIPPSIPQNHLPTTQQPATQNTKAASPPHPQSEPAQAQPPEVNPTLAYNPPLPNPAQTQPTTRNTRERHSLPPPSLQPQQPQPIIHRQQKYTAQNEITERLPPMHKAPTPKPVQPQRESLRLIHDFEQPLAQRFRAHYYAHEHNLHTEPQIVPKQQPILIATTNLEPKTTYPPTPKPQPKATPSPRQQPQSRWAFLTPSPTPSPSGFFTGRTTRKA